MLVLGVPEKQRRHGDDHEHHRARAEVGELDRHLREERRWWVFSHSRIGDVDPLRAAVLHPVAHLGEAEGAGDGDEDADDEEDADGGVEARRPEAGGAEAPEDEVPERVEAPAGAWRRSPARGGVVAGRGSVLVMAGMLSRARAATLSGWPRGVTFRASAPWPSGKAADCKSAIRRFDSDRRL